GFTTGRTGRKTGNGSRSREKQPSYRKPRRAPAAAHSRDDQVHFEEGDRQRHAGRRGPGGRTVAVNREPALPGEREPVERDAAVPRRGLQGALLFHAREGRSRSRGEAPRADGDGPEAFDLRPAEA